MGDWPANNWRAARERNNPDARWHFIIWDAESARALRHWTAHQTFVGGLAFSPDGSLLASGSQDTSVVVWDLTKAK